MLSSINWSTIFLGLLNLLIGGVLVALVKSRPALKKIANDREANLLSERASEMASMRRDIFELQARLERNVEVRENERREFEEKITNTRETERKTREAEAAVFRHQLNNISQCLDGLLLLLDQDPAKAAEAAVTIRRMRADQLSREAAEKATMRAAFIKV